MCWSKRSSQDQTETTTTAGSWTSTAATVSCPSDSISCSDDEYCSRRGKCCKIVGQQDFCVCFTNYTGKFCEQRDYSFLASQQASTTIGIAVGVALLFVVVIVALVVFIVVLRFKKRNQDRRQPAANVGGSLMMDSRDNNNDSVENGGCATKSSNATNDNDTRKYDEDNAIT